MRLFISFFKIMKDNAAFSASAAIRDAFDGMEEAKSETLSKVLKILPFFISGFSSAFLSKSCLKPSMASFAFPSPATMEGSSTPSTSSS